MNDDSSIIYNKNNISNGVKIGHFSVIYDNVIIGQNTIIGDNCILGSNNSQQLTVIGNNCNIRSNSIIYPNVVIGNDFTMGHHSLIRNNVQINNSVQFGSFCQLTNGVYIGDYTKINSYVSICTNTIIGKFVWIFPKVIFLNDPLPPSRALQSIIVQDFCVICSNSTIMPGVRINKFGFVGATSKVHRDVQYNQAVSGNPINTICNTNKLFIPKYNLINPIYQYLKYPYNSTAMQIIKENLKEQQYENRTN